jgi:hypothetical protein
MSRNNIKAIFNSANPNFYKEIVSQSFGKSLGYLSFLVLLVSLILSAKFALDLKRGIVVFSREIVERLPQIIPQGIPPIRIENGKISSPVAQPLVFAKDGFAFVLDATGKVTSLDQYKNGVLLTQNKIIFKKEKEVGTETTEYDLSRIKFDLLDIKPGDKQKGEILNITWGKRVFILSKESIARVGNTAVLLILPFFLLFSFATFLIGKLLQVLIFSLVSLVFNRSTAASLKYGNLINIGIYAITPPTVLSVVLILSTAGPGKHLVLKIWPICYMVLYGVFLSLAIIKCKQNTQVEV